MALPRAVVYCRCSTEEESQADALRNQVLESEACVKEQGWFLADKYVELKSGTTTKGRAEYNRLFEDLLTDKFDIIVIKSQDRLMRNVKDWYLFLDRMLKQGKRLFMYIERKFYTADDALITGIKAILAEEYSRELSKKINHAHRRRQKSGGKAMLNSRTFGFSKLPDGSLRVVEEEAQIIRKIYEYSAAGYGSRSIANIFFSQGYVKRTGNTLTATAVGRIIRNPLYKGVMIMNRVHFDFETKKTIKVREDQWIYGQGAVPAIVEPKLWDQANRAMTDRASGFCRGNHKRGSAQGICQLSGKLVCGQCGRPFYRTRRRGQGDRERMVIEWKCGNYLERGRKVPEGCDSVHVEETTIYDILEKVSTRYYGFGQRERDHLLNHGMELLRKSLGEVPMKREWERIKGEEKRLAGQKALLLTKFLEGVISDKDYQKKDHELEKAIMELKNKEDGLKQREGEIQNLEQRMQKIRDRLENGGMEKAAAARMLEDVREIRVHEWKLEICFDPVKIKENGLARERVSGDFAIWEDYPFAPETARGRYLDRRKIMELIKREPGMTARKLAGEMGRSVYMTRNRVKELVKGGYIRFNGRGGHGVWEVLRELPDKEESIRAGGL